MIIHQCNLPPLGFTGNALFFLFLFKNINCRDSLITMRFLRASIICVLSKNKKNKATFHLNSVHFYKCILHRRVRVNVFVLVKGSF